MPKILEMHKITFKKFIKLVPKSCLILELQTRFLQKPAKKERIPSVLHEIENMDTIAAALIKVKNVEKYKMKLRFDDSHYIDLAEEEKLYSNRPKIAKDAEMDVEKKEKKITGDAILNGILTKGKNAENLNLAITK